MKNSRIAQTLRSLSVTPSLESDGAEDSTIETGPAGEGVVKQTLEEAQTDQADAKIGESEDKDLTVKTVEVGERADNESAETESEDSVVSQEGIGDFFNKAKRLEKKLAKLRKDLDSTDYMLADAKKVLKQVQSEGGTEKKIASLKEEVAELEEDRKDILEVIKAVEGDLAKAKQAKPSQEGIEEEVGDLTVKQTEVGERSDLESAETESEDSQDLEVSQEGLLAVAAISSLIAVAVGYAGNKAGKLKNEYIDLQKQIKVKRAQLDHLIVASEAEAKLALKKSKVSQESISKDLEGLDNQKLGTGTRRVLAGLSGLAAGGVFAMGSPVQAAVQAGVATAVLLVNIAAVTKAKSDLSALEAKLAAKELEIIKLANEAEQKGTTVSQESIDEIAVEVARGVAQGAAAAAEAVAAAVDGNAGDEAVADATDGGEAVVEEAVVEETAEEVEAIEAGEAEVEEVDSEIAEIEEHAEKYEQAAATMESLVEALRDAQQTGGLNQQAARFFNISFEHVGVTLTGSPFQNAHGEAAIPSLESFGGTMRRDQATTISMEAAENWLQKIIEVLKKTWAQIVTWVKKFVSAIFSQSARYKQRAEALIAASKKIGGQKAKSNKIKFATADKIAVGKRVSLDSLNTLVNVAAFASERSKAGQNLADSIAEILNETSAKMTSITSAEGWQQFAVSSVGRLGSVDRTGEFRSTLYKHKRTDGMKTIYATDVLPGNVRLELHSIETDQEAVEKVVDENSLGGVIKALLSKALSHGRTYVEHDGTELSDAERELPTLTAGQIESVAKSVQRILTAVEFTKKNVDAIKSDFRASVSTGGEGQSTMARVVMNAMANGASKTLSDYCGGVSKALKYAVGTSGVFLDYAAASAKQYGAASAAPAA